MIWHKGSDSDIINRLEILYNSILRNIIIQSILGSLLNWIGDNILWLFRRKNVNPPKLSGKNVSTPLYRWEKYAHCPPKSMR